MIRRIICLSAVCVELLSILLAPAYTIAAADTPLVIYQLQTGATKAATKEFIAVYNNTTDSVDVTGWCVTYSSASDSTTPTKLGCVVTPGPSVKIMLPSHTSLTMASDEFIAEHEGFVPDIIFSAGMATASGHIRLLNAEKQEVDRLGWGGALNPEGTAATAHANGKILQRVISETEGVLMDQDDNSTDFAETTQDVTLDETGELRQSMLYEEEVPVDVCSNIDGQQAVLPAGYLLDTAGNCQPDVCLNIVGLQIDVPNGYTSTDDDNCVLDPLEGATLTINELLANPISYDTGKEYIEIYNPNDRSVSLEGYVLQVAPNFTKSYPLPSGQTILPGSYRVFSDTETNITLPNSSAGLRLLAPNGNVVSLTETYSSPKVNIAWALIGQTWQYTNRPTPGGVNVANVEESEPIADEEVDGLAPCPAGQYRNTNTNRCRLLVSVASALVTCKVGQERNPDTNRCRSVIAASSLLAPCKAGQERNPETNRCRNTGGSKELAACSEGQERNPDTNRCRKAVLSANTNSIAKVSDVATTTSGSGIRWWLIGTGATATLGYAIYEWRRDIANHFHRRRISKISK